MVDVSAKPDTVREAVAQATVHMQAATVELIEANAGPKGDVLATARIAGIQAAKRCWELIPLCHPLMLSSVIVELWPEPENRCIAIRARCKTRGPTGVEMEALTAAGVAALTVLDMCKGVDRGIRIADLCVLEKRGGKSGTWKRGS